MLTIMTIAGPIALLLLLLWAITHNRQTRREKQLTEDATRQRRQEQAAIDRTESDAAR